MKPKVLFILHLPPPVHGAAVVGDLIKNSEMINRELDARYINLSTSVTVDDIGKGGISKIWRFLKLFFSVFIKTVSFRPKLVYVTMTAKGTGFYKDAILVLLLKMLGRKVVFHFHNKGIVQYQHKRFDNFLYRTVFRKSDVILLSPRLKTDIEKYVKEDCIYYCPNGLYEENIPEKNRNRNNSSSPVKLLFIGNLAVSKGVFDLLDAIKIVQDKGIDVSCTIVGGEGSVSKDELIDRIKSMNLQSIISYVGKLTGEAKNKLLFSSDMLVHPAHEECFPLVLLEAMNYALPVISTIEGGIPDIVKDGETGFLIEKRNVEQLANRIAELAADSGMQALMGDKGKTRFTENFTVQLFENRFVTILKHLTR